MTKTRFQPKQLVRAKQSCSIDVDGTTYTFTSKSQPVRADYPPVKSNPDLFEAVDADYEPPTTATAA